MIGLGLTVIIVTWMTGQFVFWIQQRHQNQNERRSDGGNDGQLLRQRPSTSSSSSSSSQKQLVDTPAFNSDFRKSKMNDKQKTSIALKATTTGTKTTTTTTTTTSKSFENGMTWDTLSFPRVPPEYQPTRQLDYGSGDNNNNIDGENRIPPIHGLLYGTPPDLTKLPKWIRDYVVWHASVRQQYPGMELFTNPDAPPLLIRTCLGLCGGLHDRIGQLPWDLYLAAKTKRVLLIAWQRPKSLEYFLQPALLSSSTSNARLDGIALDWTVPRAAKFGFDDIKLVRSNVTELFAGYKDAQPELKFFDTGGDFDTAIERAVSGEFSNVKILRHRLLGHLYQDVLEERLQRDGWYDHDDDDASAKPSDIHRTPTFGRIFHLFFRPSNAVHELIANTMAELGLLMTSSQKDQQRQYYEVAPFHAVHCRVRHPKAHAKGNVVKGKNDKYPADKTGLPWEPGSPTRQFAVDTAQTALQCAHDVIQQDDQGHGPIYFLADSNDLVRHISSELHDEKYLSVNASQVSSGLMTTVKDLDTIGSTPVARNVDMETAHIDRQKGRDPPAYYATLVDLYIAMHAQCVVYGIGYYAAFAAKISGTSCQYLYAIEEWGAQVDKRKKSGTGAGERDDTSSGSGAHLCPNVVNTK